MKVQRLYTINELRAEVFPGRCRRWIVERVKAGDFPGAVRDANGWLIPAAGVLEYLERNRVQAGQPATTRSYHFSRESGPRPGSE